uniref:LRAT domain-containing protein n=1 Tax=Sparus aurata TaxID=8175 RepID=A0A671WQW4_SPAAU
MFPVSFSSKSIQKPKPGDLIEMPRLHNPAQTLSVSLFLLKGEVSGAASNTLMSLPTEKAMVRREKLQEAVGDNKWRINNSLDKKNEPPSASIIVDQALGQVGKTTKYTVISENCEHFANELRYGKHESQQVSGSSFFFTNDSFCGFGEKHRRVSSVRQDVILCFLKLYIYQSCE